MLNVHTNKDQSRDCAMLKQMTPERWLRYRMS